MVESAALGIEAWRLVNTYIEQPVADGQAQEMTPEQKRAAIKAEMRRKRGRG